MTYSKSYFFVGLAAPHNLLVLHARWCHYPVVPDRALNAGTVDKHGAPTPQTVPARTGEQVAVGPTAGAARNSPVAAHGRLSQVISRC